MLTYNGLHCNVSLINHPKFALFVLEADPLHEVCYLEYIGGGDSSHYVLWPLNSWYAELERRKEVKGLEISFREKLKQMAAIPVQVDTEESLTLKIAAAAVAGEQELVLALVGQLTKMKEQPMIDEQRESTFYDMLDKQAEERDNQLGEELDKIHERNKDRELGL